MNERWQVTSDVPGYFISTVEMPVGLPFLGYNFETMVFPRTDQGEVDYLDLVCERSQTKEEAIANHTRLFGLFADHKN